MIALVMTNTLPVLWMFQFLSYDFKVTLISILINSILHYLNYINFRPIKKMKSKPVNK